MTPAPRPDDGSPAVAVIRAVAMVGLLVLVPTWVLIAFDPPERCTTTTPTTTAPTAAPTSPTSPTAPTSATSPTTVTPAGPTRTCQPAGLTDPPLAVLGLVTLLLAIPVLGLTEVGFAGLTVKRSAEKAAAAAKEATEAAQQAAAAASSVASARASSASAGNVVVFGGDSEEFAALDAGVAFTFATAGVIAFLLSLPDVHDASVLWLDQATSSLRPASDDSSSGVDALGDLGEVVRRSKPSVIEIQDGRTLGLLSTPAPANAIALPARLPPEPAVGLVLAVLDSQADPREVTRKVEKAVRAAALHITVFTTAGRDSERRPRW